MRYLTGNSNICEQSWKTLRKTDKASWTAEQDVNSDEGLSRELGNLESNLKGILREVF